MEGFVRALTGPGLHPNSHHGLKVLALAKGADDLASKHPKCQQIANVRGLVVTIFVWVRDQNKML